MGWNVAHVITHLELGGAQMATLTQVERSSFAEGRRVLLAAPIGKLVARARALRRARYVPVPSLRRPIDPGRDAAALLHLVRELRRLERPLLVHTHSPKAGVLGRLAARIVRADAVVHSFHGFGHGRGPLGAVLGGVERVSAYLADAYTVDSQANQRQGQSESLFAGRPVEVVHCGVDLNAFRHDPVARFAVRRELNVKDNEFLVLTLANFKAQKDPMTFLRVVERVCARRPDVIFAYAGEGPLRRDVEGALAARQLGTRVRLLGWREDAPRLLSAADLFLLTSRWEGLPQTLGQAMAAGLPIVATEVDGTPEAVEHGKTGYLAPAGDSAGLAQAVLRSVSDRTESASMGRAGLERAHRFSEATMLQTLDRFYRQVTGG